MTAVKMPNSSVANPGTSSGIYTGNYFSSNAAAGQSQWTLTPNHGTGSQYDTGNATFRRTDPNGDVWTIWSEYFTRLGGSVSGRTLGGYVDLPGKITQFKYFIAAGSFEDGDFTLQIER